jgi:hypothetical protein
MNNQNYTKLLKSVRDFIDRNYMEKEKLISFVDFRDRPKSRKDCSLHPVWQSVAPKPLAIIDAFSISISYLFFYAESILCLRFFSLFQYIHTALREK